MVAAILISFLIGHRATYPLPCEEDEEEDGEMGGEVEEDLGDGAEEEDEMGSGK